MTEPVGRPPSSEDAPWPVRTVSQKVSQWISRLGEVWVDGEVAQLTRRGATAFLTLRDPAVNMSLSVTCPVGLVDGDGVDLREGARVVVRARPEFYAQRGTFSLRASALRQVGLGELLARIERLKRLLGAEGLFRPDRKRPLPFLPTGVGLVTGRNGAAEHDVVTTARRRWPGVRIDVRRCAVQGRYAAAEVIEQAQALDRDPSIDVIVIARGGGSVEDLLPFSDEGLCRAVAAMTTPVVSAIGHETDAPLLDHVADVRASTPTDAAKRVVPDVLDELALVAGQRHRARHTLRRRLDAEAAGLRAVRSRPCLADRFRLVDGRAEEVAGLRSRARRTVAHRLDLAVAEVGTLRARAVALSPQSTLDRGYAVLQRTSGAVVLDPAGVAVGETLRARVARGRLDVVVDRTGEEDG